MLTQQEKDNAFNVGFMDKLAGYDTMLAAEAPGLLERLYRYFQPNPVTAGTMLTAAKNVALAPITIPAKALKYQLKGMNWGNKKLQELEYRLSGFPAEDAAAMVDDLEKVKMEKALSTAGTIRRPLLLGAYRNIYDVPEVDIQDILDKLSKRTRASHALQMRGYSGAAAEKAIRDAELNKYLNVDLKVG